MLMELSPERNYLQWDGSEREDGMELVRDAGAGAGEVNSSS